MSNGSELGTYLRDRRGRLDPKALGFAQGRRRTPGLRREEVAQRAQISPTWYTWLEQGRGGPPSADVLDRVARALLLTDVEREHLFLLGLGRPPDLRYRKCDDVTPRLQRVLDTFELSPAFVRTALWDVIAWNQAACVILTDYGSLPVEHRNVLRLLFLDPRVRAAQEDWPGVARFVVASFRGDVARAGATEEAKPLVDQLCRLSPEFHALWHYNDVEHFGGGTKQLKHPMLGSLAMEYSAFSVEGRPDLTMVVYSPESKEDLQKLASRLRKSKSHQRELPGR